MTSAPTPGRTRPPPPARPPDQAMPWPPSAGTRCSCLAATMPAPISARPGSMTSAPTPGRTKPPAPARPHDSYHAMASLGGDQVLLFGGYNGSYVGDTWVYDLSANTWTNQAPAAAPSARHTMPWPTSAGTRCSCLAGRCRSAVTVRPGSMTSATTPGRTSPRARPSPRYDHAMAYLGGDQVLLFGGYDGTSLLRRHLGL